MRVRNVMRRQNETNFNRLNLFHPSTYGSLFTVGAVFTVVGLNAELRAGMQPKIPPPRKNHRPPLGSLWIPHSDTCGNQHQNHDTKFFLRGNFQKFALDKLMCSFTAPTLRYPIYSRTLSWIPQPTWSPS
jgi:hypothetical protein